MTAKRQTKKKATAHAQAAGGPGTANAQRDSGIRIKLSYLRLYLKHYDKLAIAFSGGVDSTLLLQVASQVLPGKVLALTAQVPMSPAADQARAQEFCQSLGVRQIMVTPDVMELPEVAHNAPERCYVCKKAIFTAMAKAAQAEGFSTLCDGTIVDDLADFRPGLKALVELKITSPLKDAGFTKKDIRAASRELDLPTWNAQSNACLATRFPYGTDLDADLMCSIDSLESDLRAKGFSPVRVRAHGNLARVEVPQAQLKKICSEKTSSFLVQECKKAGFAYVTLDLEGFRSGSMNEGLDA